MFDIHLTQGHYVPLLLVVILMLSAIAGLSLIYKIATPVNEPTGVAQLRVARAKIIENFRGAIQVNTLPLSIEYPTDTSTEFKIFVGIRDLDGMIIVFGVRAPLHYWEWLCEGTF